MPESARLSHLIPFQPRDIPGLAAFWHFTEPGTEFAATQGEPYTLRSQSGELMVVKDPGAPLGGSALELREGQWLNIARQACPRLNIRGPEGRLTLVAWVNRGQKSNGECEFIAGMWNESDGGRQYGLFLNISVWNERDQVTGHLSNVGGPTPGYKYCIDGPVGATPVPRGEWSVVAMSYDAVSGYAWLNGVLDARSGLNPYSMAGGLFGSESLDQGSDFTLGAVDRGGTIGNFFTGKLAGLAVYDRALTPAEIFALANL